LFSCHEFTLLFKSNETATTTRVWENRLQLTTEQKRKGKVWELKVQ